ncbi:hypothetical protein [Phaeobacter sp. J2-8]|uniref:hypothetical protein n=1 Tax=Phaeobacter sp. J2-8 TaxID=2931394 RepID=UPI001FD0F4D7|nr:hypothetical protein [Phaeobacter sp. J2-8]MCJ7874863.1 hypothetical protein [Phaeobacter sp. J2-8]
MAKPTAPTTPRPKRVVDSKIHFFTTLLLLNEMSLRDTNQVVASLMIFNAQGRRCAGMIPSGSRIYIRADALRILRMAGKRQKASVVRKALVHDPHQLVMRRSLSPGTSTNCKIGNSLFDQHLG